MSDGTRQQILGRELYGTPIEWLESIYEYLSETFKQLQDGDPGQVNLAKARVSLAQTILDLENYHKDIGENES